MSTGLGRDGMGRDRHRGVVGTAPPPHHLPTYEVEQALALLVLGLRHLQACRRTHWMGDEPTWVVVLRQSCPAILLVILAQHEEEAAAAPAYSSSPATIH